MSTYSWTTKLQRILTASRTWPRLVRLVVESPKHVTVKARIVQYPREIGSTRNPTWAKCSIHSWLGFALAFWAGAVSHCGVHTACEDYKQRCRRSCIVEVVLVFEEIGCN